ncbi:MAG: hypothetical protein JST93_22000 [Acidobacteria bacterium]|nr:hypothetical protein [Acidobacteriota bacterium]
MWITLLFFAALSFAQTAVVVTIAGGERGYGGDGGPGAGAQFSLASVANPCDPARFEQVSHLSVDGEGNVYVADSNNHRIRRIGANGVVETVAGSGTRPAVNLRCEAITGIGDGPVLESRLFTPSMAVMHGNGNLIVADQMNNRVRQVVAGQISTLAGSGLHNLFAPGIPATASPMDWPTALGVDAAGLVYFSEMHSNRVGRVEANGRLAAVAGVGFPGFSGDGGRAVAATLRRPTGMAFDAAGNLYIADSGNHRVRKVDAAGLITTVAGNGRAEFGGDGGPAVEASLNNPMDVKVDLEGNLYIADTLNHRVRKVDAAGVITTVAGTGEPGRGEDLVAAAESAVDHPSSVAVDRAGDLYFTDWQNHRVRKVVFGDRPVIAGVKDAVVLGTVSMSVAGVRMSGDVEIDGAPATVEAVSETGVTILLPDGLGVGVHTLRVGRSDLVAFRVVEP